MKKIDSYKLSVTWGDGKVEGLAVDLPEYLLRELQAYFAELEELRAEHDAGVRDEPYSFAPDLPVNLRCGVCDPSNNYVCFYCEQFYEGESK